MRVSRLLFLLHDRTQDGTLEWEEGEEEDDFEVYTANYGSLELRLLLGESETLIIKNETMVLPFHSHELPTKEADQLKLLRLRLQGPNSEYLEQVIALLEEEELPPASVEEPTPEPHLTQVPETELGEDLPPEPPTEESLVELQNLFSGKGEVFKVPEFESSGLEHILDALGPPTLDIADQIRSLYEVSATVQWTAKQLPTPLRTILFEHLIARHRNIIDSGVRDPRIGETFHRLLASLQQSDAGYIHGFSRRNQPRGFNWLEDVLTTWDLLLGDEPQVEEAIPVSQEKKSKSKIKRKSQESSLQSWQYIDRVRGSKAILVGGSPTRREHVVRRLKNEFQFEILDWFPGTNASEAKNVAQKILSGKYDYAIWLTRWASGELQKIVKPAINESGAQIIVVTHGYGDIRVKLAFEEAFEARSPPAEAR